MSNLRNLFITVLLQVLLPVVLSLQATAQSKVSFSFSLQTRSSTSAGVFKKDGTLVRTIWSGESLNAGSHIKTWDGLDNEGMSVQDNYDIKVLSNNLTYNWEGVIGNTLSNTRGSFERIYGMAFSGNNGYVALG
ncbi:MAG: hypothetical protein H7320_00410, partial [Ferruginibacter sp.]|nr:hypothetical protein [Ferruginibacter sp.]